VGRLFFPNVAIPDMHISHFNIFDFTTFDNIIDVLSKKCSWIRKNNPKYWYLYLIALNLAENYWHWPLEEGYPSECLFFWFLFNWSKYKLIHYQNFVHIYGLSLWVSPQCGQKGLLSMRTTSILMRCTFNAGSAQCRRMYVQCGLPQYQRDVRSIRAISIPYRCTFNACYLHTIDMYVQCGQRPVQKNVRSMRATSIPKRCTFNAGYLQTIEMHVQCVLSPHHRDVRSKRALPSAGGCTFNAGYLNTK
jgi:hypothetical protein